MSQYPLVVPDDLILEILSRVPVKSLIRFKCVSKLWESHVSDPTLIEMHLKKSSKNAHILLALKDIRLAFQYPYTCVVPWSIHRAFENSSSSDDKDDCYHLEINRQVIGSCNGLVCLRGYHHEKYSKSDEHWVQLWNPATRKISQKSPHLHDYYFGWDKHLHDDMFNGRLRPTRYVKFGFGYDDMSDTYKVVVLLVDIKSENAEVIVYSIGGENCWRKISNCSIVPLIDHTNGQFVSGTINWLALNKLNSSQHSSTNVTINEMVILSFDLRNETYKHLLLPNGITEAPIDPNLGVLKDCLYFFHDHNKTHFVVWKMTEFGDEKSWIQLINVSYVHLQTYSNVAYQLIPLWVSENDENMLLVNNAGLEIIMYNMRNSGVARIRTGMKLWFKLDNYVQSLVSPFRN